MSLRRTKSVADILPGTDADAASIEIVLSAERSDEAPPSILIGDVAFRTLDDETLPATVVTKAVTVAINELMLALFNTD
jgi:hypothetical protein